MFSSVWNWVSTNSSGIQAVCIVFSAIAAFAVIWYSGKISRRESTIQMVHAQFGEEGDHYADFKDLMLRIEEAGQSVEDYVTQTTDNRPGRDTLLRQLNRYELISLGIKERVFDESFYKLWFYSQLTKDFMNLKPLVEGIRKDEANDAYFCEFEALASRWNRRKHPVKHPPKWRILWWVVSNQRGRARNALRIR